MQVWSLDAHPTLTGFRSEAKRIIQPSETYFHLFLTPPYARASRSVLDYLYFSTHAEPTKLYCHSNSKVTVHLSEVSVKSCTGFPHPFECKITMTSPCSSGDLQFIIYEIDNDFYNLRTVPELSDAITSSSKNAQEAQAFLEALNNEELNECLDEMNRLVFSAEVDEKNMNNFADSLRGFLDSVSNIIFSLPEITVLPMGIKKTLNMLIFNAISAKFHYTLLMAFNSAFLKENKNAQVASRYTSTAIQVDKDKAEIAVRHLHNILHLPNPIDMINCLVKFFDAMVAALPGVEVAADDILPAICMAMTRDLGFGSHVVSFFNYLSEIWPPAGMDERITYILVTCSIAAQHLAHTQKEEPKPVESKQTQETIGMLEDLLNCI